MKVQIGGKRIFFDVEGPEYVLDGKQIKKPPTLIVIHGAGGSDDEPDGIFSLDRWADELVEFCNKLDIDKPIMLGGSGGGFVAMAYGIRHPDHAGKLLLASTQAKLDTDRAIKAFGRLGGSEFGETSQKKLSNVFGSS